MKKNILKNIDLDSGEKIYPIDNFSINKKLDIKEVITHEFTLEETEEAILTAKQGNAGKIIIKVEE